MIYIKDKEFIRGNSPMTKEEIRILSIAKLELRDGYVLLDVGAGTGSVSIQMSKCCPKGEILAIEKDLEALEVLTKNIDKFKVTNMTVIQGEALEVCKGINKEFDGIFVGGSGGNIEEIIKQYSLKLKPGRNMVLNFITIDNLYKAMSTLKELGFDTECLQLSVSKTKGESYMLFANNPIFILTGRKSEEVKNG
ncbi:MAG: precorrin-6Y C5,15-methyltransferase (decarboxylating) subunit CbiT [Clostridiaceae bacterium]|nr:precorrin-6Y C5,15-methyltransferase (decarboxylating) subunit CbiT [Clostridiaceae bacterium]